MVQAQQPAHPVAAGQQGLDGVRDLLTGGQQQGQRGREEVVRRLQLVVRLQGLRGHLPRRRVQRARGTDAVDDRPGLGLVAVLPEVGRFQGLDQVRVVDGGLGAPEQVVVERARAGAVAREFQMGRGLEDQRFVVLGVLRRGAEQALGFGGVVGRRVGAHGPHGTAGRLRRGGEGGDEKRGWEGDEKGEKSGEL